MVIDILREQLDKAITFFEDEIEQYGIKLKGILPKEYRKHLENVISHYQTALYALNKLK